jgi:hypothetical protein
LYAPLSVSPLCRPPLFRHVRRRRPPLRRIAAWHFPCRQSGDRQRSIVPSSWTIARNLTPDWYNAHIAAFAERHTHHWPPACKIASRSARCAGVHLPDRDFSSMPIDVPRCQTSTSGTPA